MTNKGNLHSGLGPPRFPRWEGGRPPAAALPECSPSPPHPIPGQPLPFGKASHPCPPAPLLSSRVPPGRGAADQRQKVCFPSINAVFFFFKLSLPSLLSPHSRSRYPGGQGRELSPRPKSCKFRGEVRPGLGSWARALVGFQTWSAEGAALPPCVSTRPIRVGRYRPTTPWHPAPITASALCTHNLCYSLSPKATWLL